MAVMQNRHRKECPNSNQFSGFTGCDWDIDYSQTGNDIFNAEAAIDPMLEHLSKHNNKSYMQSLWDMANSHKLLEELETKAA